MESPGWIVRESYLNRPSSRHLPRRSSRYFFSMRNLKKITGLRAKRAMYVYDRAVKGVADSEKLCMYEIYIARATEWCPPKLGKFTRSKYLELEKIDLLVFLS